MRCLIVSAEGAPVDTVLDVLLEQGLQPVPSAELGSGASLAAADLTGIVSAVAVLPETGGGDVSAPPGIAAILIEIGVVLGRHIPTLVLISPADPMLPALSSVPFAALRLSDRDALRLHLGIFARTLTRDGGSRTDAPALDWTWPKIDIAAERRRLHEILERPGHTTSLRFQQFVIDILSRAGAQIEANISVEDRGVDAVIGLGGRGKPPLVVLVEVKRLANGPSTIDSAITQLSHHLITRHGHFGLLVVDQPAPTSMSGTAPALILAISADELLDRLSSEPLDRLLRQARNRAVHGV